MHSYSPYVPVVVQKFGPRPEPVKPVVVRQLSAPCLVHASLTAVAAPPGPANKVGPVDLEPLPTWAAPATPPSKSPQREEAPKGHITDSETGVPADVHSNGAASESDECVSEESGQMRAKLEATRNELVEKMAELMKLEANLSVALGEKPTVWSSCPSDCSKLDPAIQHFTSLSAQSSVDMQDRTIGVVTEEFESESPVESVPPMKSQSRSTRAVGTTTDDLAGLSEENVKDVSLSQSQTSSSPDTTAKKDSNEASALFCLNTLHQCKSM